jgi:hypothetical protein
MLCCPHSGVGACSSRIFYGPPKSVIVAQFHDLTTTLQVQDPIVALFHLRRLPKEGGRPEGRPRRSLALVLLLRWQGDKIPAALFDDFHDATAARLHDYRPIVHDRIPVARSHMILAGYRVKRHTSRGQHRADAHIALVPE